MKVKRALSSATLLGAVVLIEGWSHGRPAGFYSASQRSVVRPVAPQDRRDFLLDSTAGSAAATIAVAFAAAAAPAPSIAVGTLPETAPLEKVAVQGIVRVSTTASVLDFLTKGLGMTVLRREKYKVNDKTAITTTVAFGPEQLSIPTDFVPGISSFAGYGGHFKLQLVEIEDEKGDGMMRFYEPGNGLAYIQLGVPSYRISKILEYGGEITSSYGFTEVTAPGGLPLRIILGSSVRDPFMFQALYATDLKASEKFYTEKLGMKRCKYPRARPVEQSSFEPAQPKGSVYLSFSDDSFGVLLLPRAKEDAKKGPVRAGDVYGGVVVAMESSDLKDAPALVDPDGFGVSFIDATSLGVQEGATTAQVVPVRTSAPTDGRDTVEM